MPLVQGMMVAVPTSLAHLSHGIQGDDEVGRALSGILKIENPLEQGPLLLRATVNIPAVQ